jgi:hypothetical protein
MPPILHGMYPDVVRFDLDMACNLCTERPDIESGTIHTTVAAASGKEGSEIEKMIKETGDPSEVVAEPADGADNHAAAVRISRFRRERTDKNKKHTRSRYARAVAKI